MAAPEPASVEDYFSDDTMGRKEQLMLRRHNAPVSRTMAIRPPGTVNSAAQGTISETDFERAIKDLIPLPLTDDGAPARGPFRDGEILRMAELLEHYGKHEWSLRPRIFAILRMIGCVAVIDEFLCHNLTDIALPFTETNLPNAVKGPKARSRFIDLQSLVLTPHVADLEKAGAGHKNFSRSADEYFISKRELGSGGFGQVDHVWSRLSLDDFARKRISRGRSFKKDKVQIAMFQNELETMKKLSHRHLVKLVGSYTDPTYVGLIMSPVADMNLETFLATSSVDPRHRQICLRRFFGCLATAVQYLHEKKIRHKDIKSKNILVKGREVLVADFGTSTHWSDDTLGTTSGTVLDPLTQRYCAPEVSNGEKRGTPSDIWSLGCVFLEMATVLCNHTAEEMKEFFTSHGTKGLYVRTNEEASMLWTETVKRQPDSEDDTQPLALVHWMTKRSPEDRPTAQQVVNTIFEFEGQHAFCGICCYDDSNTKTSYTGSVSSVIEENDDALKFPSMSSTGSISGSPTRSTIHEDVPASPSTGPVTTGTQIHRDAGIVMGREIFPGGSTEAQSSVAVTKPEDCTRSPSILTTIESQTTLLQLRDRCDYSKLVCQWPFCRLTLYHNVTFDGKESLEGHYRKSHFVHEYSWSRILPWKLDSPRVSRIPDNVSLPNRELILLSSHPRQFVNDTNSSTLQDGSEIVRDFGQRMNKFGKNLKGKGKANSSAMRDLSPRSRGRDPAIASQPEVSRETEPVDDGRRRFGLLDDSRRPEPTVPPPEVHIESGRVNRFVLPEPLALPPIGRVAPSKENKKAFSQEGIEPLSLPESTFVPSYLLAGTNRFTKAEVNDFLPRIRSPSVLTKGPSPLFVYGSFMFPSIIRARAEYFLKGHYSPRHQRRLYPDDLDWARANVSLKHAAELMTPALLKGYDRWRPRGLACAAIQNADDTRTTLSLIDEAGLTPPPLSKFPGEVKGLLIFGLTEEALKCCEELFCDEPFRDVTKDPDVQAFERWDFSQDTEMPDVPRRKIRESGSLERQNVQVDFALDSGRTMTVNAVTFVWNRRCHGLQGDWDINRFVKSRSFVEWSSGVIDWTEQEEELARAMSMSYMLPGDPMSDAIQRGRIDEVEDMLEDGDNPDAPCHGYGSVLQAAVAEGNEAIVRLLLSSGAHVNVKGGKYQNALLAATVRGHENIARLLLDSGAKVLEDGGRFVSSLYQAVSHSDEDMIHLLLERGAWLTKGYAEILDLAAERDNEDIIDLLIEYDARNVHLTLPSYADRIEDSDRELNAPFDQQVVRSRTDVLKAVLGKAFVLKGKRGKWTGSKGVQLVRAAVGAGMDPSVIDHIGEHLSSLSKIINYLKDALSGMGDQHGQDNVKRIGSGIRMPDVIPFAALASAVLVATRPSRTKNDPRTAEPSSETDYSSDSSSDTETRNPRIITTSPEKTMCPVCEGRGGRRGTGWHCSVCNGHGRCRDVSRDGKEVRNVQCNTCRGGGRVFADRDRCRHCDGLRFVLSRDTTNIARPSGSYRERYEPYPRPPPPPVARDRGRNADLNRRGTPSTSSSNIYQPDSHMNRDRQDRW